jgi:diacylglycerol kinase
MSFIRRQLRRCGFALNGVRYAIRFDRSFRLAWYGVGAVVALALVIFAPLTLAEFLFLTLAYLLILITELQNSALEYALDHLHPETHDNIGRSKDMAAGAVLLGGVFLLIVLVTLIVTRLP